MKKRFQVSPILLLAVAAVLLLGSTVGSTQAALTYYSENYSAEVTVSNIGISLVENGNDISRRNYLKDDQWDEVRGTLFADMLAEGEKFVLGETYPEVLTVKNSGAIDTYVRVIITKSWKDAQGVKDTTLSPALIDLELKLLDDTNQPNGWIIDQEASTAERTVLYYTKVVPVDGSTAAFTKSLWVDPAVATKVIETVETETVDGQVLRTITYEHEYDGYTFCVDVEVDAVQKNNAKDAIKSAWGVDVTVTDGVLSLGAPAVQE